MYFMLPGVHHLQQADEWKTVKIIIIICKLISIIY